MGTPDKKSDQLVWNRSPGCIPKKNAKGLLREFYESGLLTGEVCRTLRLLAQHERSVRLAAHGGGGPVHSSMYCTYGQGSPNYGYG